MNISHFAYIHSTVDEHLYNNQINSSTTSADLHILICVLVDVVCISVGYIPKSGIFESEVM